MFGSLYDSKYPVSKLRFFQEKTTAPAPGDSAAAPDETTDSSSNDSPETSNEYDPFKKYQEIRHQDFGEIVFRKTKKSKKKANKGRFIRTKLRKAAVL